MKAECNNQEWKELRQELLSLRERQHLIEAAFESAYEGIVLVDHEGKIVMLNDTYAKFLQVDAREVIGRHVSEVIENTRMHIVVKTGKSELAQVQRIRGGDVLVHRILTAYFKTDVLAAPVLKSGQADAVARHIQSETAGSAKGYAVDVTKEDQIIQAVEQLLKKRGRIDVIINNAGLQHIDPVERFPLSKWNQLLNVMLTGPFLLMKHAVPVMRKNRTTGGLSIFRLCTAKRLHLLNRPIFQPSTGWWG